MHAPTMTEIAARLGITRRALADRIANHGTMEAAIGMGGKIHGNQCRARHEYLHLGMLKTPGEWWMYGGGAKSKSKFTKLVDVEGVAAALKWQAEPKKYKAGTAGKGRPSIDDMIPKMNYLNCKPDCRPRHKTEYGIKHLIGLR